MNTIKTNRNLGINAEKFLNVDGFRNATGEPQATATGTETPRPQAPAAAANQNPIIQPEHMSTVAISSGIGQLAGIGIGAMRYVKQKNKAPGTQSVWGILGWWFLGAIAGGIAGRVVSEFMPSNKAATGKSGVDGFDSFTGKVALRMKPKRVNVSPMILNPNPSSPAEMPVCYGGVAYICNSNGCQPASVNGAYAGICAAMSI